MSGREKSVEIQPELIQNIHWGFARAQILTTAVEMDIFTVVQTAGGSLDKVAKTMALPLRATRMLLDALTGMGLLHKTRGLYKLNPEAKAFLVKGEGDYLGPSLLQDEGMVQSWLRLTESMRSGKPVPTIETQEQRKNFFKELVKRIFPMSYASGVVLCKKLGIGRTLRPQKILDVGAGSAAWSIAFALVDSSIQVTAVDFPEVLEVAQGFIKRFRLQKQFTLREGDYHTLHFEPNTYDVIILGHICHGEGEAFTRKLFKKAYDALRPEGRLLVPEFVANDLRTGPELPLMFALNMLLFTESGDVFTIKELKRWLDFVGFKKVSAQAVQYPVTVVVAIK
jgi:ubiquinone/menaquinone biosynthesis C-methylase UbiE